MSVSDEKCQASREKLSKFYFPAMAVVYTFNEVKMYTLLFRPYICHLQMSPDYVIKYLLLINCSTLYNLKQEVMIIFDTVVDMKCGVPLGYILGPVLLLRGQ